MACGARLQKDLRTVESFVSPWEKIGRRKRHCSSLCSATRAFAVRCTYNLIAIKVDIAQSKVSDASRGKVSLAFKGKLMPVWPRLSASKLRVYIASSGNYLLYRQINSCFKLNLVQFVRNFMPLKDHKVVTMRNECFNSFF